MTLVEITYLSEKGRIPASSEQDVAALLSGQSNNYYVAPLDAAVAQALTHISRQTVPDMPDRILAATALHLGGPLITRDLRIQAAPNF